MAKSLFPVRGILLAKDSLRQLRESVCVENIKYAIGRSLAGGRGTSQGWECQTKKLQVDVVGKQEGYQHTVKLQFHKQHGQHDSEVQQWLRIVEIVESAVKSKGWYVAQADLKDIEPTDEAGELTIGSKPFQVQDLNTDPGKHFGHIYEREEQVSIIQSALVALKKSGLRNRYHCLCVGPPACGKTETLLAVKRMVGEDNCFTFDATSTTKAGAKKLLSESEFPPPVLIVEEIEKTAEDDLRWMLSLLDQRGEIRITNARVGNVHKSVHMLCLATCNDYALLKRRMDGALVSRFVHKIYFPRPSRTVLEHILGRELAKYEGGNKAWIKPAIDYCLEHENTHDPRRVIGVCLSGGDALLSGEYQQKLINTNISKLESASVAELEEALLLAKK